MPRRNGGKSIVKVEASSRPFRFLDEVRSIFDDDWFLRRPFLRRTGAAWSPRVDVSQEAGKLLVKADLPGVKKDDIEILLEGGSLIIQGKRAEEQQSEDVDYYRCEREEGEYYRSIALPDGVKPEAVHAGYTDGVLAITVDLPKAAESKKIPVAVK